MHMLVARSMKLYTLKTYPASCRTRLVQEDEDEGSPDGREEANQPDDKAQHHTLRDQITKTLGLQESWVGISLHRLEDIVLSGVEQLRVCSLFWAFDGILNLRQDALRNDDLSFGAWKEVCVQDLLG